MNPACEVQRALAPDRVEQHVVVRLPRRGAEVVEAGARAGRREQLRDVERHETVGTTDGIAVRVEPLDPAWSRRWRPSRAIGVHE